MKRYRSNTSGAIELGISTLSFIASCALEASGGCRE